MRRTYLTQEIIKKIIGIFLLGSLLVSFHCEAWNGTGHRLVALIAYQHLTPRARNQVNALTKVIFLSRYPKRRLLRAAVWPDRLRQRGVTAFNAWHYINLPYAPKGQKTRLVNRENVVWAIEQANAVLTRSQPNRYDKAVFLSFLVHFVGDVSQPLHCITRYNRRFPKGDLGGNRFPIMSEFAGNLHSYWDQGAGLFVRKMKLKSLILLSQQIEKQYPLAKFKSMLTYHPMRWARQSYELAIQYAYAISPGAQPTKAYQQQAQRIIKRQIALAGYRLATLLNQDFKG